MALSAGTRLGLYEILSLIGRGGMGEVYRARDTQLNRDVALKVLPNSFADDRDRLARFRREAQVLAALNHPNIAHIHGLEDSDDVRALVMELVEGPTLADCLASRAIPLEDALPMAKQIAEALEAAHEQGIVHRDLKPANIKVRRDGTVKVLDFGLAKTLDPPAAMDAAAAVVTSANTLLTQAGMILGTAAYMSPEQARGLVLDKRTDIWSFGCVLYEMLTGKRAFESNGTSDTLALVLTKEPAWTDLPSKTPASIQRLLRRALEKDRRLRLADMQDVRVEIAEALREPTHNRRGDRIESITFKQAVGVVALVSLGALGAFIGSRALNSSLTSPATRLSVMLPDDIIVAAPGELAISPDGQTIVFVGQTVEGVGLYARRLDQPEPRPLKGTENAAAPFFSPDGQWIAFINIGEATLKKIPLRGGPSEVLCKGCTTRPIGGWWGPNGWLIVAAWPNIGLLRVPDDGGTPEVLVSQPSDNTWFMWPTLIADRAIVFTTWRDGQAGIDAVSLATGERRTIITSGSHPRYIATGHLVYASEGRLLVVSFDAERLETRGSATVVIDGVSTDLQSALYDISSTGTLAYVARSTNQVVWKDRRGQSLPLTKQDRRYSLPTLSPDGARFAVTIREGFTRNLWVGNVGQEPLTRLTFGNDDLFALWTRDGKRIVFTSGRAGRYNLFLTAADGSGRPERLTDTAHAQKPTSISPSGDLFLFNDNAPSTGLDIWELSLDQHDAPRPYIQTRFNENDGMFSPNGRWVAYMSDETGRYEVYVQSYPGPGGKKRVSIDGGTAPAWNPNGTELFYQTGDALMAVSVSADGDTLSASMPERLFEHQPDRLLPGRGTNYSVARDGQRFLMVDSAQAGKRPLQSINVVLNWFQELKATLPTGK